MQRILIYYQSNNNVLWLKLMQIKIFQKISNNHQFINKKQKIKIIKSLQ